MAAWCDKGEVRRHGNGVISNDVESTGWQLSVPDHDQSNLAACLEIAAIAE
jgi:hypothetical protein